MTKPTGPVPRFPVELRLVMRADQLTRDLVDLTREVDEWGAEGRPLAALEGILLGSKPTEKRLWGHLLSTVADPHLSQFNALERVRESFGALEAIAVHYTDVDPADIPREALIGAIHSNVQGFILLRDGESRAAPAPIEGLANDWGELYFNLEVGSDRWNPRGFAAAVAAVDANGTAVRSLARLDAVSLRMFQELVQSAGDWHLDGRAEVGTLDDRLCAGFLADHIFASVESMASGISPAFLVGVMMTDPAEVCLVARETILGHARAPAGAMPAGAMPTEEAPLEAPIPEEWSEPAAAASSRDPAPPEERPSEAGAERHRRRVTTGRRFARSFETTFESTFLAAKDAVAWNNVGRPDPWMGEEPELLASAHRWADMAIRGPIAACSRFGTVVEGHEQGEWFVYDDDEPTTVAPGAASSEIPAQPAS